MICVRFRKSPNPIAQISFIVRCDDVERYAIEDDNKPNHTTMLTPQSTLSCFSKSIVRPTYDLASSPHQQHVFDVVQGLSLFDR